MRKLVESTFVSLDGVISDTQPSTVSRAEPQHWYFPVVVGAGRHLFEGAGFDTTHPKLADIDRFDSGVVVHIYVPK